MYHFEEIKLFESREKSHFSKIKKLKKELQSQEKPKKGASNNDRVDALKEDILEQKIKLETNRLKIADRKIDILGDEIGKLTGQRYVVAKELSRKTKKKKTSGSADNEKNLEEIDRKLDHLYQLRTKCFQIKFIAEGRLFVFKYEKKNKKTLPKAGSILYSPGDTYLYPYYPFGQKSNKKFKEVSLGSFELENGRYVSDVSSKYHFSIKSIEKDGDCGYTSIGINRTDALEKLLALFETNASIRKLKKLILPVIVEQFLSEPFLEFLKTEKIETGDLEALVNKHKSPKNSLEEVKKIDKSLAKIAGKKKIIKAYLKYDIEGKNICYGWAHPCILHAIAYAAGFNLRIWELGKSGCIPSAYYHKQDTDFSNTKDILFVNGNHFEQLKSVKEIPAKSKHAFVDSPLKEKFLSEEPMVDDTFEVVLAVQQEKMPRTKPKNVKSQESSDSNASTSRSQKKSSSHNTTSSAKVKKDNGATNTSSHSKIMQAVNSKTDSTKKKTSNTTSSNAQTTGTSATQAVSKSNQPKSNQCAGSLAESSSTSNQQTIFRWDGELGSVKVDYHFSAILDNEHGTGYKYEVSIDNSNAYIPNSSLAASIFKGDDTLTGKLEASLNNSKVIPDINATVLVKTVQGYKINVDLSATIGVMDSYYELGDPKKGAYCRFTAPTGEIFASGSMSLKDFERTMTYGASLNADAKCTYVREPTVLGYGLVVPGVKVTTNLACKVGYTDLAALKYSKLKLPSVKCEPPSINFEFDFTSPVTNDTWEENSASSTSRGIIVFDGTPSSLVNEQTRDLRASYSQSDSSSNENSQDNYIRSLFSPVERSYWSGSLGTFSSGGSGDGQVTSSSHEDPDKYRPGPTQARADYLSSSAYSPGPSVENARWGVK